AYAVLRVPAGMAAEPDGWSNATRRATTVAATGTSANKQPAPNNPNLKWRSKSTPAVSRLNSSARGDVEQTSGEQEQSGPAITLGGIETSVGPIATELDSAPNASAAEDSAIDGPVARMAQRYSPAAPTLAPAPRLAPAPLRSNVPPPMPSFDGGMARSTQTLEIDCDAERAKLKPINVISTNVAAEPGDFPPECGPRDDRFIPRSWSPMTYTWKASNLCHKPLYFEDERLERYGHAFPRPLQPLASAAFFFGTVPLLPYKMGIEPPTECIYALGYYRPGSCAPYHLQGFPISLRGALYEAGAVAVGWATVPANFALPQ
ncbi:MAG TPA: hypothetical protein VG713_16840, partial [Pirellulales bacterium]|nr:hypothetical protein [Pirellulales bacterium]